MDGFKIRLDESVQSKISVSVAIAIIVFAFISGSISFLTAFAEAKDLQDDVLRQIATLIDQRSLAVEEQTRVLGEDDAKEDEQVIVRRLGISYKNQDESGHGSPLFFPESLNDGIQTVQLGDEIYRVLVTTLISKERIAIAQESGLRDEIARNSALRTVVPLLLLVPVLLVLVSAAIKRIFAPISALSRDIDQRDENDLRPIDHYFLPVEIRPFVTAINRLLQRTEETLATQRRFVADAAHELRSPLTATSLQAERLAESDMSELARARLATLRKGIDRGKRVLNQLLNLAAAQTKREIVTSPISVHRLFRSVMESLIDLSEYRGVDIGVTSVHDCEVVGNESELELLIKNLVENAINYAPHNGFVDLQVLSDERGVLIRISDNGPGIPYIERKRVFDPFFRISGTELPGSGLGLSIVKAIADRNRIQIDLDYTDKSKCQGLSVTLRFAACCD